MLAKLCLDNPFIGGGGYQTLWKDSSIWRKLENVSWVEVGGFKQEDSQEVIVRTDKSCLSYLLWWIMMHFFSPDVQIYAVQGMINSYWG